MPPMPDSELRENEFQQMIQERVSVCGTSRADLNGQAGFVTAFDENKDRYVIKLDSGSSISLKRDKFMTETDRLLKAAEKKQKKRQQKQQQKFAAFQDDNSEEQEEGDEQEAEGDAAAATGFSAFNELSESEEELSEPEDETQEEEFQSVQKRSNSNNKKNKNKGGKKKKTIDDFNLDDFPSYLDEFIQPAAAATPVPEEEAAATRTQEVQKQAEPQKEVNVEQLAEIMKALQSEKQQTRKPKTASDKVTEQLMFGNEQDLVRISDKTTQKIVVMDYRKQGGGSAGGGVKCGRSDHTAGEKARIKP